MFSTISGSHKSVVGSSRQLTLALTLREESTFANFYPGSNPGVFSALQTFAALTGEPFIYLCGPPGTGRSHLLQACCHEVPPGRGIYLDLTEPGLNPAVFMDMEFFSLVCLDNIDAIMGRQDWELALFNFYNRSREQNSRLLVSSSELPGHLPCQLADLCSRLSGGLILCLNQLTDDQKLSALRMRARLRGLELSADSGNFLLHHYPRSMNHLFLALDTLDREAWAAQRRITIPFIKQVLNI